jgi:hypothetical protein
MPRVTTEIAEKESRDEVVLERQEMRGVRRDGEMADTWGGGGVSDNEEEGVSGGLPETGLGLSRNVS